MHISALDEARQRVARYESNRDAAANLVDQARGALKRAEETLAQAEAALSAAEDIYTAAIRGVAKPARKLAADTRKVVEHLMSAGGDVISLAEISEAALKAGVTVDGAALRQMAKRLTDDDVLERISRGVYRVDKERAVAAGCRLASDKCSEGGHNLTAAAAESLEAPTWEMIEEKKGSGSDGAVSTGEHSKEEEGPTDHRANATSREHPVDSDDLWRDDDLPF